MAKDLQRIALELLTDERSDDFEAVRAEAKAQLDERIKQLGNVYQEKVTDANGAYERSIRRAALVGIRAELATEEAD